MNIKTWPVRAELQILVTKRQSKFQRGSSQVIYQHKTENLMSTSLNGNILRTRETLRNVTRLFEQNTSNRMPSRIPFPAAIVVSNLYVY